MRKHLVIMLTCVLFLTLCYSGCEQFLTKSDHVEVNVMLTVSINAVDENYNPVNISLWGQLVKIEVLKNAQYRLLFDRYVQNGSCQASCSYTLNQGESIKCLATLPNGFNNYYPVNTGNVTLTWETAHANINSGGVYNWCPYITIIMMRNSTK
jgi:hypothetical protein